MNGVERLSGLAVPEQPRRHQSGMGAHQAKQLGADEARSS
jgi:hypothetical protein